ncbi:MAG TPA: CHAT domain-containing protein, partial [Alphaproteobacteria bacterium]|nr:CHAT domain-containing protein [Alphaproteobacteria bacterium]
YAGTKALVVSNWPVHSEATTELMTRMFKSLANDNTLTRAEALRRTRLTMIDEGVFKVEGKVAFSYAHPIFWAPFTIVGDGGGAKAATN